MQTLNSSLFQTYDASTAIVQGLLGTKENIDRLKVQECAIWESKIPTERKKLDKINNKRFKHKRKHRTLEKGGIISLVTTGTEKLEKTKIDFYSFEQKRQLSIIKSLETTHQHLQNQLAALQKDYDVQVHHEKIQTCIFNLVVESVPKSPELIKIEKYISSSLRLETSLREENSLGFGKILSLYQSAGQFLMGAIQAEQLTTPKTGENDFFFDSVSEEQRTEREFAKVKSLSYKAVESVLDGLSQISVNMDSREPILVSYLRHIPPIASKRIDSYSSHSGNGTMDFWISSFIDMLAECAKNSDKKSVELASKLRIFKKIVDLQANFLSCFMKDNYEKLTSVRKETLFYQDMAKTFRLDTFHMVRAKICDDRPQTLIESGTSDPSYQSDLNSNHNNISVRSLHVSDEIIEIPNLYPSTDLDDSDPEETMLLEPSQMQIVTQRQQLTSSYHSFVTQIPVSSH
eukprot:Awhi_evm1s15035